MRPTDMREKLTTVLCTLSSLVAAACALLLMASLFVSPAAAPTMIIGDQKLESDRFFLNVVWCGSLVNLEVRGRTKWEKLDTTRGTIPRSKIR